MNKLAILCAVGLGLAILGVAIYAWVSMADAALDFNGIVALTFGIIATLGLGAVLVGLMLYSNRQGYDDRAAPGLSPPGPAPKEPPGP